MSQKNTPQIRFEGFQGEWKNATFNELLTIGSGKDYKHLEPGDIPVYGTGGYMLSVNKALSMTEDALGIGRKGTIDKPFILRAPFWTVDTLFYAIPKPGIILDFLGSLAKNIAWKQYDESTGVPSLSKEAIYLISVIIPSLTEQEIIGAFFRELDELIDAEEQKLEKLRHLKATMLTKMFPQGDARVPEIRFEGFQGDWLSTKLNSIASIVGGGTPATTVEHYWGGDIDWYTPAEIGDKVYADGSHRRLTRQGLENSSARILPANRTILFTSRASIGLAAILRTNACTNQGFQSLVLNLESDPYFFYSVSMKIAEKAKALASGSTFLEISGKQLGEIVIPVPTLNEQQAIGTFFRELDVSLEAGAAKVEKLRHLKSAFLDLMFV